MKDYLSDMYDDRVVFVSFENSGLNWVRYCIEFFSGHRTPGKPRLVNYGLPIIQRTHNVDCFDQKQFQSHLKYRRKLFYEGCNFYDGRGRQVFSKMVLLLRDYRESYVRAAKLDKTKMRKYLCNIKAYHNFVGDKIFIRYEDLIKDFSEMIRILNFLKIDCNFDEFDLKYHKKRSINMYDKTNGSVTKNNVLDFNHHARTLSDKEIEEIDAYIKNRTPVDIYDKYLKKYCV